MSQQQPSPQEQLAALKQQMESLQSKMKPVGEMPAPPQPQQSQYPQIAPTQPLGAVQPANPVLPMTPTEKLKILMHAESWKILQGLIQWAIMWEAVQKGEVIPNTEDSKSVMMAPWTFFGASPATLGTLFQYVTPAFMSAYGQYEADEVFKRGNPMPWIIVQTVAPMFALVDRGREAQLQAWNVISELRRSDKLPEEQRKVA